MGRIRTRIYIGIVALSLAACAGPPVQEMSDARQAIQAAEQAGAERHAPLALEQARQFLDSAELRLEKRAYNQARRDARQAREKAAHALYISKQSGDHGDRSPPETP